MTESGEQKLQPQSHMLGTDRKIKGENYLDKNYRETVVQIEPTRSPVMQSQDAASPDLLPEFTAELVRPLLYLVSQQKF